MAKLNVKTSFNNAVITRVGDDFIISEYKVGKDSVEMTGKWNLSEKLKGISDTEYVSLSFDVKTELDTDVI